MTDTKKSNTMGDGITNIRNLILRAMSAIYLIAFVSFYYQSTGLFGNNGILPARLVVDLSRGDTISNIVRKPTLLYLAPYCGLDVQYMIDVITLLGTSISFAGLVTQKLCVLPTFGILWCLYCSLIQIVQIFGNDSDYLLLEAGFLMIILAPISRSDQSSPSDRVMLVILRWILMRYMFAIGAPKLFNRCPYWMNFTALTRYFETMPLPTVLAWVSHNFLTHWLKVANIFATMTELGCVWLLFFPHRVVKIYVFYWQVFLQFNIFITGNYGFLNIILPILMLSLLDDRYLAELNLKTVTVRAIKVLVISYLLFFGIGFIISSWVDRLKFEDKHVEFLRKIIRPAPLIAAFVIISIFLINLVTHRAIIHTRTIVQKFYGVNVLMSFSIIAISMIMLSMVPHGNIDPGTNLTNTDLGGVYRQLEKFHVVNEYGKKFRKMRSDRYEIVYEHAEDVEGPWMEYNFLYKPSNANSSLRFAGPYLPRLDFKFYDAVQANYRNELWTVSVAFRLLQGNRHVLQLLGEQSKTTPPKYVRATLYKFRYTAQLRSPQTYWIRLKVMEYFPAFSLDNIAPYLRSIKISPNYRELHVTNQILKMMLDLLREQIYSLDGSLLTFGLLMTGFVIIITKKMYRTLSSVE